MLTCSIEDQGESGKWHNTLVAYAESLQKSDAIANQDKEEEPVVNDISYQSLTLFMHLKEIQKPKSKRGKGKSTTTQGKKEPVEVQKSKPQKDKGKSKAATKEEDKGPSTSTAKVAKKSQGKKNPRIMVMSRKMIVKKTNLLKPNIKIPEKTDIQRMFENFQNDFADMTLGYGLMSVLDNSDNGRGPTLIRHSINQHDINLDFMERTFKPKIRIIGLQNAITVNTIIMGVEKSWIESSNLKPLEDGLYTNRVSDTVRMQALVQYQQARNELAKKHTDQILVNSLKNAK
ncbi:hypothetical protein JVT61DRAFT_10884 [Boletus reticuloceps]|uniref:Uncharacterized protein n=1 Tax=Boletus reticuloceps TaxID=495285 RepID=A0A8I2YFE2_9AGAM|nr:hypothetical protein JVT61DRAFT_10884 [Boletus reticuloceps]